MINVEYLFDAFHQCGQYKQPFHDETMRSIMFDEKQETRFLLPIPLNINFKLNPEFRIREYKPTLVCALKTKAFPLQYNTFREYIQYIRHSEIPVFIR